jgi:hypothetical protein
VPGRLAERRRASVERGKGFRAAQKVGVITKRGSQDADEDMRLWKTAPSALAASTCPLCIALEGDRMCIATRTMPAQLYEGWTILSIEICLACLR